MPKLVAIRLLIPAGSNTGIELLLNNHIAELRLIAGTQGSENLSLKTNYAIAKV
jgi:hypothetical protein